MEFVIISGLSGAGKSKAASFMEDMDFFCVDNLPAPLIPKFAELGMAGSGEYDRVVLVTDIRGGTNFDSLFQALTDLKAMKCAYRILFMDASDETIIKRYKESRRSHPLAEECDSLEQAIPLERQMLEPLRRRAPPVRGHRPCSSRADQRTGLACGGEPPGLGKKLMAGAVAWIRDTEQVCPFRERSGYERYVAQPPAVGAGAQDRRCGRRYGPFHHAARLKKIYQESDRHRHCGG